MEDLGMLIQADFSAVPDRVLPLPPGIYDFFCEKIEKKLPKPKADGTVSQGYSIVAGLKVKDGPHEGRNITTYIWISTDPTQSKEDRERNLTGIKRFLLAFGVPITPQGANPLDAVGKVAKALVKADVYEGRETSRVDKFFIPGDAELSTAPTI